MTVDPTNTRSAAAAIRRHPPRLDLVDRKNASDEHAGGYTCASAPVAPSLDRDRAEMLAAALKALADPTRLQLLSLIRDSAGGEACVCDLTEAFDYSQPTISHHLGILMKAGFLERSKRGSWAWYSIPPDQRATVEQVLPARQNLKLA